MFRGQTLKGGAVRLPMPGVHTRRLGRFRRFPLPAPGRPPLAERLAVRFQRFGPIHCPVCGRLSYATRFGESPTGFRDAAFCASCLATNRQRQLGYLLCQVLARRTGRPVTALPQATAIGGHVVYNTEAQGPVHRQLEAMPGYRCSEYLGPDLAAGTLVGGIEHQDLTALSYPDASVDVVLSSDVLEHIPDPYRAHAEIHRVLRPGGSHLFTVPFHQTWFHDEPRAAVDADGSVTLLAEPAIYHTDAPLYHGDPTQPSPGVLVYTIFGLQMLVRLREIGFDTSLYQLYLPSRGILGPNAIVFEAIRQP
jgi:Methyltransferase domain